MVSHKTPNKRVLLIGGEGFIGRNISEKLSVSGSYDSFSLGLHKSFFKNRNDLFIKNNPYKNRVKDIYDVYIHLIDNKISDPFFEIEEKKLIKNLKISKEHHLIIFSSAIVYSNPDSEYGIRKLKLESFYKKYCAENSINLTILRLFNTYGKYQLPYKQGSLIANIFYNYLNNLPIEINDKTVKRDFIYAEDIAEFIKYVILNKKFGIMDLRTGKCISIDSLLSLIQEKILPTKMKINYKNLKEKVIEQAISDDLYKKVEQTSLLDGLKKTFKFYNDNNETISKYLNIDKVI